MKKSELINLSLYSSSEIGYDSLRTKIGSIFGKAIFEFRSMEEIIFETLKLIDKTSNVKFNQKSLRENILIVLKHFKLENPKRIAVREAYDGKKKPETDFPELYNFYCFILSFDKLPKTQLAIIRKSVEKDLKEINDLVSHYESLEVIKTLMLGKEVHGSNNVIVHLYGRCLKERQNILDFYMKGMYSRAFQMSKYGMDVGTRTYLMNTISFRPYDFNHLAFGTNYDYRNIECSWHRMYTSDGWDGETAFELSSIYKENKEVFYEKFFEIEPIEKIFNRIEEYLLILPIQKQRKEIIIEAQRLFIANEWLAFYAIILPQVEGIFKEMYDASRASGHWDSLPKKVRAIRDFSNNNDIMLDYYEYILPAQRNKFSHGGLPENLKILAYDMLTDLENVLYLYSDLRSPLIEVNRLITRKNPYDFPDYISYSALFDSINNLTPKEKKQIDSKIDSFNIDFLLMNEDILSELTKVSFDDFYNDRNVMNADLKQRNLPTLGTVPDMVKAINNDEALIAKYYFEATNIFANSYHLNGFFSPLKKYSKTYLKSNFMKEGLAKWETEKNVFRNIIQMADFFDSRYSNEN